MHRLIALLPGVAFVVGIAAAPAAAQECRGTITAAEAEKAEDARYAAQMKGDYAALEKLIGDDLVYTHSNAMVDDKANYIKAMQSGAAFYKSMKRSDVKVRTYGCIAVLTGRADFLVLQKGQENNVVLRFTTVWAKREGGPQFISWQATRLPQQ